MPRTSSDRTRRKILDAAWRARYGVTQGTTATQEVERPTA